MHEDDFSSEKVCGANTSSRRAKHECEMTIFLDLRNRKLCYSSV